MTTLIGVNSTGYNLNRKKNYVKINCKSQIIITIREKINFKSNVRIFFSK